MIRIKLSEILGKKRMTQAELARKTDIRPNTISDLYNELTYHINLKQLYKICKVLKCDISDILEIVDDKNSKK